MTGMKTLIFVYNSNSGGVMAFRDFSASPAIPSGTDRCTLSTITHSPVGMKKEWKRFLKDLEIPSRCMDRIEFFAEFKTGHSQTTFPVVLVQTGSELAVLISTEELNQCRDLNDLILLMKERLLPGPRVQ
jgi:hypothetical protein